MKILLIVSLFITGNQANAQKFISNVASVTFFSEAPLENIEARNSKATSIFDLSTGEIVFSIPIAAFEFRKSLMKTHFNENYMESEAYPKSTFRGKVTGFKPSVGMYGSIAVGVIEIHGVSKEIEIEGTVDVRENTVIIKASFPVSLKDYDVKIPRLLFSNIAETVEVNIDFRYKPYASN
jgi:polyisoprenoid-binding protein YceI